MGTHKLQKLFGIIKVALIIITGVIVLRVVTSPTIVDAQSTPLLKLSGTTLVTSSGSRFIVKGANIEFYRDSGCSYVTTGETTKKSQIVAKFKSLGINAVRFNYRASWLDDGTNLNDLLDFMQLFAQNGIFVMPSDHSFTGKDLVNYQTTSYPMFQAIVNGARSRGFEQYLIMNPYNEPYGTSAANTPENWIAANKNTVNYIRTTLNFKGVIVLDTRTWASNYDPATMTQLSTYDASLMGVSNVVFSNHWYPNHDYTTRVKPSLDNSGSVPVLIGELGQINPGTTPVVASYPVSVLNNVVTSGIPKGHNGVFAWMWNWCDENSMTSDDFVTLNTYGQMYVDSYYSKVSNSTVPSLPPVSSPSPRPTVAPTTAPTIVPAPSTGPVTSGGFLTAVGKDLKFGGQTIYLRGANYANIKALKARKGQNGDWVWTSTASVNDVYITEDDYRKVAELGGNHFRFGLSFSWWRESKASFYQLLDQQIAWGRKHGVWLVLNMFTTPGDCYEGYSEYCGIWGSLDEQQQLKNFWVEVATRYKNEPVIAGYDLLNEPTPTEAIGWSKGWYSIAQDIRNAVAAVDPNHLVFIEATSDALFFNKFTGNNIVYEVHDYEPMGLSHCAYGTPGQYSYPGYVPNWENKNVYFDKKSLTGGGMPEANILENYSINWAARNSVPIYIGEWGPSGDCFNSHILYTQDRSDIYKQYGVHHAVYSWRAGATRWGIFPDTGALVPHDANKLNAVTSGWIGSGRPSFTGTIATPIPTPQPVPTVTPTSTPVPPTSGLFGDVNLDGSVNNTDYNQLVTQYSDNRTQPSDLNSDNTVNIYDIVKLAVLTGKAGVQSTPQPTAQPVVSTPIPTGTTVGIYPKQLNSSNSKIQLVEVKAPEGNKVFIRVDVDPSVTALQIDWYLNGKWTTQDKSKPFYLGGDTNGVPNGYVLPAGSTQIRSVVYYNTTQNYIDSFTTYSF